MKKMLKPLLIAIVVLGVAAAAYAAYVTCPFDNMSMYFTGRTTTTDMGKMLYEYKCPGGHVNWIVQ